MPQDPVRAANMASLCRLEREEFTRLYLLDRLELDRGTLSTEEYWARILRSAGVPPNPGLIARIEEEDSLGWTRINRRVVDWSAELRAAGYATAILSNMPVDKLAYMRRIPAFDFIDDFPVRVFSCDHRLVKPEPETFARRGKWRPSRSAASWRRLPSASTPNTNLMGKRPDECVFLDDSLVNVEGGRAAGIATVHFASAEEAAPELSEKWSLPVRSLLNGSRG